MKQNDLNQPKHLRVGVTGEALVERWLVERGYLILARNYRKSWGELDIVAEKDKIVHFVEVKSVSRESLYRPEENVHPWKVKRLSRIIQTFLSDKRFHVEHCDWQFDVAVVCFGREEGRQVTYIEDLIL